LPTLAFATHALASQINDSEQLVLTLMSWLGESSLPWHINSELGDVSATAPPFTRPLFRFLPYNIDLDAQWLERELGASPPERTVAKPRSMTTRPDPPRTAASKSGWPSSARHRDRRQRPAGGLR
jgi:hypothetical protein